MISTSMIETEIEWPGIPEEFSKSFKNVQFEEDLFTWAEMVHLGDSSEEVDEQDDWDEDEEESEDE